MPKAERLLSFKCGSKVLIKARPKWHEVFRALGGADLYGASTLSYDRRVNLSLNTTQPFLRAVSSTIPSLNINAFKGQLSQGAC